VLGAASRGESAVESQDGAGLNIGLRRLDLARYLAVPAIVVRRGAHQIAVSEYHRWAEVPDVGINRAFASYLSAAPQIRAVDIAPWTARAAHDYLIQLHVSRFEGVAPDSMAVQGEAVLLASWEVIRPDGALMARGTTDYRVDGWRVGDYAGLVTLLDSGLNELARDVVSCLGQLVGTRAGLPGEDEEKPNLAFTCAARAEQAQ
jgi:uncharacterized lipoprotein YmbA